MFLVTLWSSRRRQRQQSARRAHEQRSKSGMRGTVRCGESNICSEAQKWSGWLRSRRDVGRVANDDGGAAPAEVHLTASANPLADTPAVVQRRAVTALLMAPLGLEPASQ